MANTAEGITVGDEQGLDPNRPGDFEVIMGARGVEVEEGEVRSPDRSIESGLTVAGPEQQAGRDPDTGRFVSNQEVKTPPAATPAATDTSGAEVEGDLADDPDVQAVLAKYGGDPVKAIKALADAQSLIGRRDQEREALATQLAELKGTVAGLTAATARPAAAPLSDDQVTEVATGRIESLGYEGAATEAANHSHASGDGRALDAIMDQWYIESPSKAMNFITDFRLWEREQVAAQQTPGETPAWQVDAEEAVKVKQYGEALVTLRSQVGAEAFPLVAQHLDAALDQMPQNVLNMIDSDDPEAREQGFGIVADRALRLAGAPKSGEAPAPASVERKLAGARVASGALRPAEKAPEAPTNREDAIKEFKRAIVEAPTTTVASGLTYGPTP